MARGVSSRDIMTADRSTDGLAVRLFLKEPFLAAVFDIPDEPSYYKDVPKTLKTLTKHKLYARPGSLSAVRNGDYQAVWS